MSFRQRQDTELWNNQFPETKILGLPVSQRMPALAKNMVYRDKIDVDSFQKDIQYASTSTLSVYIMFLAKAGMRRETDVLISWSLKIDYSRAPCLGADQKTRGLWERDWPRHTSSARA